MKRLCILMITFLIVVLAANAQDEKGIKFEIGLSWEQVLAKAKVENKYTFVDCFTTWCGPCRFMSDSIFTKKDVGDFMDQHFINIQLQMDVTVKDGGEVKNRYGDAKMVMEKYKVTGFPTYLFFAPDGELIYQGSGAFADAPSFVAKAAKALDTDEQYFFLLEQYNKGRKDPDFVSRLLEAAKRVGDEKMIIKLKKV